MYYRLVSLPQTAIWCVLTISVAPTSLDTDLQRLDPAVMHVSCIQAGTLLARLGRPEVGNCIAALEQYGAAYEEAAEHAVEIKRIYALAKAGDFDFNHMASVAPRTIPDNSHNMNIDPPSFGGDINSSSLAVSMYGR
jgi:hypothetical protein